MKVYVDPKVKLEDMKSTAWSFTIIAVLGLILILLLDIGVIPVRMTMDTKIIMSIVMSVLFLFFLYTGIKAFLSIQSIRQSAELEESLYEELTQWFLDNCKDEMLSLHTDVSDIDDADRESSDEMESDPMYFPRYEHMVQLILEKDPSLSEEFVDHLVEDLYGKLFPENL